MRSPRSLTAAVAALAVLAGACTGSADEAAPAAAGAAAANDGLPADADGPLVVYSGREEELVGPVFASFEESTGIDIEVRYGGTSELAATILEEGGSSPADVFWAQDAGALGALAKKGRFQALPEDITSAVEPAFASATDEWVGVTGRVRTIVYSTDTLTEEQVPDSVFELTDERWKGRVGWAPTNGSFQAFITAMRDLHGEEITEQWVKDMVANGVKEYPKNTPIVDAAGRGEIDLGLVNHYYLFRFLAEDPGFPAANKFLAKDVGGLVNVAGVGILDSSQRTTASRALVSYLLGQQAQSYFGSFADELEYPLAKGIEAAPELPSLESLEPPTVDLSDLDDLQGTLELLRRAGALS
ncbi:MAG: iron(III) transport system substrate-binding protein [Glaciecola sp.]|jgi:iron(III) transport system substrate-binding protein